MKQQASDPQPSCPSQRQYRNIGNRNTCEMREEMAEWEIRMEVPSMKGRFSKHGTRKHIQLGRVEKRGLKRIPVLGRKWEL